MITLIEGKLDEGMAGGRPTKHIAEDIGASRYSEIKRIGLKKEAIETTSEYLLILELGNKKR